LTEAVCASTAALILKDLQKALPMKRPASRTNVAVRDGNKGQVEKVET
jgi:hypothetical protein